MPQTIDFGARCQPNKEYLKSLVLQSNSFVDFEYTLKVVLAHPDFTIKSELQGSLKAYSDTELLFSYTASYHATAEAVVEFCSSQFDCKPKLIRLVASAIAQNILTAVCSPREPSPKAKKLTVDQPVL